MHFDCIVHDDTLAPHNALYPNLELLHPDAMFIRDAFIKLKFLFVFAYAVATEDDWLYSDCALCRPLKSTCGIRYLADLHMKNICIAILRYSYVQLCNDSHY